MKLQVQVADAIWAVMVVTAVVLPEGPVKECGEHHPHDMIVGMLIGLLFVPALTCSVIAIFRNPTIFGGRDDQA